MPTKWSECKNRKSSDSVKNGKQDGLQRYKRKACGSVFRGKKRKYSAEFKLDAIIDRFGT